MGIRLSRCLADLRALGCRLGCQLIGRAFEDEILLAWCGRLEEELHVLLDCYGDGLSGVAVFAYGEDDFLGSRADAVGDDCVHLQHAG